MIYVLLAVSLTIFFHIGGIWSLLLEYDQENEKSITGEPRYTALISSFQETADKSEKSPYEESKFDILGGDSKMCLLNSISQKWWFDSSVMSWNSLFPMNFLISPYFAENRETKESFLLFSFFFSSSSFFSSVFWLLLQLRNPYCKSYHLLRRFCKLSPLVPWRIYDLGRLQSKLKTKKNNTGLFKHSFTEHPILCCEPHKSGTTDVDIAGLHKERHQGVGSLLFDYLGPGSESMVPNNRSRIALLWTQWIKVPNI